MKTSARFLAMLLAVVMIAGAALSVSAFDDVAGNKHANAINVLAQLEVIGGYEDGTFKPDQKVTRAEMAKLVYVLYTTFVDAGTGTTAFADVAADNWAAGYINWCSQKGIIGGYGDGKFGPNDNVTYDQALKMVCGVLGYTDFQSNLWPTDVRMTALRTLDLGEELDDVKGADQLTRAQVAQIMYNALDEKMNEMKTVSVPVGDYTIPVEVAKTLAVDVWKFAEVTFTIAGTENFGDKVKDDEINVEGKYTDKDGKEVAYDETWKLADYGLEKYAEKTDALYGLEIIALKNAKDEFISATVAGSVVDGVEIKYNAKTPTVLVIDGVEYKYNEKTPLYTWDLAKDTTANAFADDKDAKGKDIKVVAKAIVDALEDAYMARAIDVDGDGIIDRLVIAGVEFFKVAEVKKNTDKTVVLNDLAGKSAGSFKSAELTVAVEKDDVIAISDLGGINYTTIVEGVEAYATKLNANDNEITLNEIGVVEYADKVIDDSDATKVLGEDNKATYYIYNGEIIAVEGIATASEYKIAVLKDIIKVKGELNTDTMKREDTYKAVIIVNGVETEVKLSSDKDETVLTIGADKYNAKAAAEKFATELDGEPTKNVEKDGSPKYAYIILSTYTEDEDGYCTLVADKAMDADDKMITAGTIAYDADKGVYTVVDTKNSKTYNRVVLDANSVIFYTFKDEDKTGDFKHIASYSSESITEKSFTAKALTGTAYLIYNEANKTYTLAAAMVEDEIKGVLDSTTDYTNDGTLILYAPAGSAQIVKDGKYYYEYSFKKDLDNEVVESEKETKDAAQTEAGKFYGWDEKTEKYAEVKGVDSFVKVTLDEIFYTKNAVLEYNIDKTATLTDDVVIWGLDVDEDGKKVFDAYKELSIADLSAMLDEATALNTDDKADNDVAIEAYLVRTLNKDKSTNDNLVWEVKEIIVNIFETNEDTEKFEAINDLLFVAE